jgi:hypothetical protein
VFVFAREKEPVQNTSFPHLLLLFLAPSISVLLVGRSVIAQAPSDDNNTSINTNNNITPSTKETQKLKAKKNLPLSTLSDRKLFF